MPHACRLSQHASSAISACNHTHLLFVAWLSWLYVGRLRRLPSSLAHGCASSSSTVASTLTELHRQKHHILSLWVSVFQLQMSYTSGTVQHKRTRILLKIRTRSSIRNASAQLVCFRHTAKSWSSIYVVPTETEKRLEVALRLVVRHRKAPQRPRVRIDTE